MNPLRFEAGLFLCHHLMNKLINNVCRQWERAQAKIPTSIPLHELQNAGSPAEDCPVASIAEENLHVGQAMFPDGCTQIEPSRPSFSAARENHISLL